MFLYAIGLAKVDTLLITGLYILGDENENYKEPIRDVDLDSMATVEQLKAGTLVNNHSGKLISILNPC